jgi:hypothetical protein
VRFNLKVPFAEKDAAKKLGARWDAASKVWFVIGDDMAAFSKWSPMPAESSAAPVAQKVAPAKMQASGKIHVGSDYVEHPRVCECLPWDVCDKCRATALSI